MTELTKLTLAQAREGLRKKEFSATELTQAFLQAIERRERRRSTPTCCRRPSWRSAQAKESDKRLKEGKARPLEGLPLGNKDLFCTQDQRTTACSKILDDFKPPYESTVGANLWNAGAVMLGKLNCDEFAMGSSNETSAFGPVVSPWRRKGKDGALSTDKLVPGGSSGGSSAAVAADLCLAATATDTGGSIRQPAALTGIVGIKPTYGRCSRWGIVAFASSLDQAGPLAKTVTDAAIMLKAMASHDPRDSTSVDAPVPDYEAALAEGRQGPAHRRAEGIPRRGHVGRDRQAVEPGHRLAQGGGRDHPRHHRCRTPSTRCRPTTSSRPPRPPPTSRATTACATACARPART